MGAADIVPGVSGGTVALVLGHYERLVTAISRVDATALRMLKNRHWGAAFAHVDGAFLVALGVGIGVGMLSLASLMHWLLEHRTAEMMSVFFGLVLASGLVVSTHVRRWSSAAIAACLAAGIVAFALGTLSPRTADPTLPHLFFSALVAICAMILPGISGAFLLLLLGVYHPVMGMLRALAHAQVTPDGVLRLAVFALGCATGLAVFSRILRVLLQNHHDLTFAALLGLMLGSLGKLWPLQVPTSETAGLPFKERHWISVGPSAWDEPLWPLVGLAAAAAAIVVAANYFARRRASRLDS